MNPMFMPEVLQAVAGEGNMVYAYFNDGTVRRYDMSELLTRGGVFTQLRDRKVFVDALTVMNGTVAWDVEGNHDPENCIDIDPCALYESPVTKDPLEESA